MSGKKHNSKHTEEQKVRGITPNDFKTYSKAIVIKIVQYWWKNGHTYQWTRREPRCRSISRVKRLLMKEQRQFNGERITFSTNGARTTGCLHVKKRRRKKKQLNTDLISLPNLTQNRLQT